MSAVADNPLIEILDKGDEQLHRIILNGIRSFNERLFTNQPPGQDLTIALRDPRTGKAVGGLVSRMSGGWLAIEMIFVPEEFRGMGVATKLIAMAEKEAVKRGCHSAWLDTVSAEATRLYQRNGYAVFGELKDYPVGSSRMFLQKRLVP
ncbi:GNAT family N-acetyltransferase [Microvirga solisilvae]|uniref:GNAT family N-acetyltransferase n=1 Tax=Microvirga solisilvae TaxID=2919498 RepID=UPI001FAFB7D9|nr:GNAT family N-acetyltransferase [Microvirga solisilvae]